MLHVSLSCPTSTNLYVCTIRFVILIIRFGHQRLSWFLYFNLFSFYFWFIWNLFNLDIITCMLRVTDSFKCFFLTSYIIIYSRSFFYKITFFRFWSGAFLLKLVKRWTIISKNMIWYLRLRLMLLNFLFWWIYNFKLI